MKKIFTVFSALAFISAFAGAQVLDKQQIKNTTWTGFGAPVDGSAMFYGITDTLQARFDRGNFTIEGMLNWGFLANYDNEGDVDNFVLGTSNLNPLSLKYGTRRNSGNITAYAGDNTVSATASAKVLAKTGITPNNQANVSNTIQDSYYVNFIWHPAAYFDVGLGTKLNWQVGPAPRYGNWLWESDAHVRQGGFSTAYDDRAGTVIQTSSEYAGTYKYTVDAPGSADVVGFVPYANKYAKRAIGVRYNTEKFQIGLAIPNGFNTDNPAVNAGIDLAPVNWLKVGAAIEGAFEEQANFYTGATIGADNFIIDMYFAADSLFTDEDDDEAYGTGAAISFTIPDTKINLRPELGVNFFENSHYDFAWYTGASLSFAISKTLGFSVWGSWAQGSKDDRWDDIDGCEDWNGGHVLNIRPQLSINFSKKTSFSVYADFEQRTAFDGENRSCWSSGIFMTNYL